MAEWDNPLLVPVTVTMNVPLTVAVHDRLLVPDPVTLVGVSVQVIPVAGEALEDSETIPLKPFSAVTVIVEVPAVPLFTLIDVGLAVIVKSCTV